MPNRPIRTRTILVILACRCGATATAMDRDVEGFRHLSAEGLDPYRARRIAVVDQLPRGASIAPSSWNKANARGALRPGPVIQNRPVTVLLHGESRRGLRDCRGDRVAMGRLGKSGCYPAVVVRRGKAHEASSMGPHALVSSLRPYWSTFTFSRVTSPLPIMPSSASRKALIFSSASMISITIGKSSDRRRIFAV